MLLNVNVSEILNHCQNQLFSPSSFYTISFEAHVYAKIIQMDFVKSF